MINIFTPTQGLLALFCYGLVMLALGVWSKYRRNQDKNEFLLAGRNVGIFAGALSAAASWVWAPALFVGSQKAYEQGVAGVFSFCFPNFFALIVFSFVALKARKIFPQGFTLPQLMGEKYGEGVKRLYLVQFVGLQICSFSIQILAGSTLLSLLTGLSQTIIGGCLVFISLIYSIIGGLRASIVTDVLQMLLILVVIGITVPSVVYQAGGIEAVLGGLGGKSGSGGNIFDLWTLYSFGIPAAITLLSGPVSDQMHWQRAYSLRSDKQVVKTFTLAACFFILVPLSLSILGFVAANPAVSQGMVISSSQMVGPITVSYFLPVFMLVLFSIMLLSGLGSTLDSVLCAVSALIAIDIFQIQNTSAGYQKRNLKIARLGMLGIGIVGLIMTIIPGVSIIHLWFFATTFRAPSFVPTLLTLFWKKSLQRETVFFAILLAFLIGGPVYVYGAITSNPHLVVAGSILPIIVSTLICVFYRRNAILPAE